MFKINHIYSLDLYARSKSRYKESFSLTFQHNFPSLPRHQLMSSHQKTVTLSWNARPAAIPATPSLSWHRLDNNPLPKDRSTVSNKNTLTITNLSSEDAGSYICEAGNKFGVTHAHASLVVEGIPDLVVAMDYL